MEQLSGSVRQELKTTQLELEWENEVEGVDLGVICTDITQEDRTFVAREGIQHPGWTFTTAQHTESEDGKERRSQG